MNQSEYYKQQAETLGEFFKHYGFHNITPVPSKTNYDLAVQIMIQQGEKNENRTRKVSLGNSSIRYD